jgi:hypothetical protein
MSDITNSDDNSSTYKSPSLSSKRKNTPTQARRSSSATSSRIAANPRRESGVRGGISKRGGSQNNRNKSKGPSKTRKKKVDGALNIDTEGEMYDDNDISSSNLQHDDDSDEQQHALNLSSASADTIITRKLNKKAQKQKRPIEHFSIIGGSDKVKCSLCERVSNLFFVSALKALSSA